MDNVHLREISKQSKADVGLKCLCDKPLCAKCLGINCQDVGCPTHTEKDKIAWHERREFSENMEQYNSKQKHVQCAGSVLGGIYCKCTKCNFTTLYCFREEMPFPLESNIKKNARVCHNCGTKVYMEEGLSECPNCKMSGKNTGEGDICTKCKEGILREIDEPEPSRNRTICVLRKRKWWELTEDKIVLLILIAFIALLVSSGLLFHYHKKLWYLPLVPVLLFLLGLFWAAIDDIKKKKSKTKILREKHPHWCATFDKD